MEKGTSFKKFKSFKLSDKELSEFEIEAKKIDKETAEARKLLERQLPFASEKTLETRFHPPGGCRSDKSV